MTTTENFLFGGALRLFQPARGHRAGTDGVLLAASLPPGAIRIADLGASTGLVGLRAAQLNEAAHVSLIEKEPALAELARQNVEANGLANRVAVIEADALSPALKPWRESFDCVMTNPPFHEAGRTRMSSAKAGAYVMSGGADLDSWLRLATTLLKPRGAILVIHRADRLGDLLTSLDRRFGNISLRFIHPRQDEAAIRVIARGVKGSRAPLAVLPPVILHEDDGKPSAESVALHAGIARLG